MKPPRAPVNVVLISMDQLGRRYSMRPKHRGRLRSIPDFPDPLYCDDLNEVCWRLEGVLAFEYMRGMPTTA